MASFAWIKTIFSDLGKVFKPVEEKAISDFEAKLGDLGSDGITLMQDSITYVGTLGLSNTAARDAAVAKFKTDAVTAGKDLAGWAENELNLLVELAYLGLKPTITAAIAAA